MAFISILRVKQSSSNQRWFWWTWRRIYQTYCVSECPAFYTRLKPEIKIIGTGGIRNGQDAFEHLLCGASMLQIGTELHKEGVAILIVSVKN